MMHSMIGKRRRFRFAVWPIPVYFSEKFQFTLGWLCFARISIVKTQNRTQGSLTNAAYGAEAHFFLFHDLEIAKHHNVHPRDCWRKNPAELSTSNWGTIVFPSFCTYQKYRQSSPKNTPQLPWKVEHQKPSPMALPTKRQKTCVLPRF